MVVYLDSDEYGNLHHFVLGFKMYSDTIEMDEKKQLMRYYDQLKQSILENANYIEYGAIYFFCEFNAESN